MSALPVFLIHTPSLSQVAKITQAGAIEGGFGITPNLTGASAVAVKGNYAYVVGVGDVLQVLDITLPGLPVAKGSLTNGVGGAVIQRPQHIVVQGNYAYITSEAASALEVVDISNPTQPVHKTVIRDGGGVAPYLNNAWGLFLSGNHLYVTFESGLEVMDISNPAFPVHQGSIHDGGGTAPFLTGVLSVFVSGNLAYVGTQSALEVIDVSNPALPIHTGVLFDGGGVEPFLSKAYSVNVVGNYAYVANSIQSAIEIIDVSNPAQPVHATTIVSDDLTPNMHLQGAFGLTVSGNYLYVVGDAFEVINITDPLVPVHEGGLADAKIKSAKEITIVGNYAYVPSQSNNGLTLIDISNPSLPVIKGNVISGAGGAKIYGAKTAVVEGKYAYVTSGGSSARQSGFEIVDISDPSVPLHASDIDLSNTGPNSNGFSTDNIYSAAKKGNSVLLANHKDNALVLVDVTNPLLPFEKSTLNNGTNGAMLGGAISVQFHPSPTFPQAYVASEYANAVELVQLFDPANPLIHLGTVVDGNGSAPYLNRPTSLIVQYTYFATYAYVTSAGSHALEILDLSTPGMGVHEGSLLDGNGSAPFLKFPKSNFLQGNYVYIADYGSSALEIIDVTDPSAPVHKGAFKSPILDSLNSVYVSGNYAYITCAAYNISGLPENGRIVVVDISDPSNPVHYETFTNGTGGALIDYPTSITISGNYGYVTNAGLFDALDIIYLYGPATTSFNPASASVGSPVTVTGKNFNTFVTPSIDGVPVDVTQVSENAITFIVPPGATNGPIALTYAGQNFPVPGNFVVIPTSLTATNVQQNSFKADWSDVGATKYFLDLSSDNFVTTVGVYNNFALGNVTSFLITGLDPATMYQYRVRSSDGTLISGNSNVTLVLTPPAIPVATEPALTNQTNFTANWTTVSGATNYFLDVATDETFTKFLVGYNNLSIPATAQQSQSVTGLTSFTNYYYRVRSANATGSSPSSNVIQVTTLDITAPEISNSLVPNPTTLTGGSAPVFNSVITDNVNVNSAAIFYRGIAQQKFESASLQGPGGLGGNYSITIQPSWYDSLGLEYYFLAEDKAGNETVSPHSFVQMITTSITLPTLPSGLNQSDYRIVSFPYQLSTDNKITTVYNNVPWNDNTKAGLWWWNPNQKNGAGDYDQYGVSASLQVIDIGKGYWMITSTPVSPTLSNVPAPKYNQSNLYSMILKPGWNEIGNPYPMSISWDDVLAYNQLINPGALFGPLTIYDGTGYKSATGSTLLAPFEGGFVKNLGSSDITIQIPFKGQAGSGGRVGSMTSDISDDNWNIFLYINQNDRINQLGGFGMHPMAIAGADRFDNFNPPAFLGIPEVNFSNTEYPGMMFSNDIVSTQVSYTWTFTPSGTIGQAAQLNWNTELNTIFSRQLFLLDEESLNIIDMRQVNQYDFVLTKASHFRIFYGDDVEKKITTPMVVASAPYPNPLGSDNKTSIKLSLPESSSDYAVNVQIYNAQGIVIRSVNERLTSGVHPLEFALRESVSQGIYIYKLAVIGEKISFIHNGKIIKQ